MEFYDVHFSYIDNETMSEEFVSVPEQGSSSLIPEGVMKAGQVCFASGAKKILLPMVNAVDICTVPPELFAKF